MTGYNEASHVISNHNMYVEYILIGDSYITLDVTLNHDAAGPRQRP